MAPRSGFRARPAGFRALLRGEDIAADIEARVNRIAQRAGEGFFAHVETRRTRSRGSVVAAWNQARAAEERNRALSAAVDAGRGDTR